MGSEQQEDHVVHHVLIAQAAFFFGGLAQLAEEIRGLAGPFLRDQIGDEFFQVAASCHAPVPQGARNRQAQYRQGGIRGVDKGFIYLVGFRAHVQAEENLRAHIQQQCLDMVEEA